MFSERFRMKLDDGKDSVQTITGALCSLFIVALVLLYSYLKLDILLHRKDVDVLSTTKDFEISESENFTYDNGFNIAVGFIAYDNESGQELDRSYGEIVFNSYGWGAYPNGTRYSERKEIPHRGCTKGELGFEEGPSQKSFFSAN